MEMDTCFQNLNKVIWDTSEANFQVSFINKNSHKSRGYFQLTNDIQAIKNDSSSLHIVWKDRGFEKQSTTHIDFKAKRNEYRSAIRKFIAVKKTVKLLIYVKH